MYRRVLCISLALVVAFAALANGTGVCTGYPKTYNGKPCASTTRYYDGNMGACGCGTSNTSPFSWQYSKPTAAASAPIYGAGSWCGSGCGKCFKLTPTAVGASPIGKGAPNLNSIVVKVTNLCPYGGNEEWCAMDVNSHDYDAHFDLMDQNMAGIVTKAGWDNPEVTYEEVSCADNGYTDWNCQCASGDSKQASSTSSTKAPATAATTKPVVTTKPAVTTKPVGTTTTTKAPVKATTTTTKKPVAVTTTTTKAAVKPVATTKATTSTTTTKQAPTSSGSSIKLTVNQGTGIWWFGFSLPMDVSYAKVEVMDAVAAASPTQIWSPMSHHGNEHWGMWYYNPSAEMKYPLSLRFTSAAGKTVVATGIIGSYDPVEVDTKVSL